MMKGGTFLKATLNRFLPSFVIPCSLFLVCLFAVSSCFALEPDEIVVIANSRQPAGVALARNYMARRQVPAENLLLLDTVSSEGCSRATYNKEIAPAVRRFVKQRPKTLCLLLFYGLPLRINGLRVPSPDTNQNRDNDPVASLDSELSLIKVADYPLKGWLANPYFLQFQQPEEKEKLPYSKTDVLMVARLDGPDEATVQRLINDSVEVEKEGLTGKAYFDARWPPPVTENKKLTGYKLYDHAIHQAAARVEKLLPTLLNQEERLFAAGEAPQAALYCGWYSLASYVDAFAWQPGAVAYHIASAECTTLKKEGSQVWCKRLLEEGVAATIGPVGEPYVQAFPFPHLFYSLLLDGDFSLVEAYQLSLPFISWKMVLIGDPLYRPFRQRGTLP